MKYPALLEKWVEGIDAKEMYGFVKYYIMLTPRAREAYKKYKIFGERAREEFVECLATREIVCLNEDDLVRVLNHYANPEWIERAVKKQQL